MNACTLIESIVVNITDDRKLLVPNIYYKPFNGKIVYKYIG